MVHAFQLLFIECDYPRAFVWWIGMHAVMFFFLFKDFYDQSYSKPKVQYSLTNSIVWLFLHQSINQIKSIVHTGARQVSAAGTGDDRDQRADLPEWFAKERIQQNSHERHDAARPHRSAGRQLTPRRRPLKARVCRSDRTTLRCALRGVGHLTGLFSVSHVRHSVTRSAVLCVPIDG